MTDFIKDLRQSVKNDLFERLDNEIRKDEKYNQDVLKIDDIVKNLHKFEDYIDEQLEVIYNKISHFNETFDLKKVKIEGDIIILFDVISNTDNFLLSAFMRNNKYYKDITKLKEILIRLLLKIYTSKGAIDTADTRGRNRNQTIKLIEDDPTMVLMNDILSKFDTFFENYQEASGKLKNKGFTLKEYYNFLMFTRGNG